MSENLGEFIVLGKIVDAYGLNGWVKIHPFADDPMAWCTMPDWWLCPCEAALSLDAWRTVGLLACRMQGASLLAQLAGVSDRTMAESLRGSLLGAPRNALPETSKDEYYWGDLIGLLVRNQQGEVLGSVFDLIETGANDVLLVRDEAGLERLLPFINSVVLEVDLTGKVLLVDWGLDW